MGKVFRALDRLTGQVVALKQVRLRSLVAKGRPPALDQTLLSGADSRTAIPRSVTVEVGQTDALPFRKNTASTQEEQRLALAQEFRILASLRHPNIISVLDYGFDQDGAPFFTMELLEGAQPLRVITKAATVYEKLELVCQLLLAQSYLHRHGIIHRDIKPANVLGVPLPDGSGWRLKVLDFGLAITDSAEARTGGTIAYMAPELFAGHPASVSSDIYAAAMVLAELLLDAHPFAFVEGDEAFVNIKRMQLAPPNLSALDNPQLASLLGRALSKLPEQRPADAATFMRELLQAVGMKLPPETAEVRDSYLLSAPFIGREAELGLLTDALHGTRWGRGSAWLIFGESGVGKSRLLEELRSLALISSVQVCRGQAVSAGGSAYQIWREVLRPLCLAVPCSDLEASVLGTLLPDLPMLLEREVQPPAELEASAAQARLHRVILSVLSRQVQPVLLLLEDLQWADAESLALLRHIARGISSRQLMIAATAREEESPRLPRELPELQVLALPRLSSTNLRRLCESMLGPAGSSSELLKLMQSETEGNAYFAVEVIRALAEESGSLEGIFRQSLPARVLTGGIQQVLRRRLRQVPAAAQPLLRLSAVAGRQLDLALLQKLFREAEQLVQSGAAAGVLEMSGDTWRFSHDKLREFLLADIRDDEARALHELLAETLDDEGLEDPERSARVAYHYREAQRPSEAAYHYMLAGEAALGRGALWEASALLQQAAQLHEQSERPLIERVRVWRALARVGLGLRQNRDIGESLHRLFALIGHPVPTRRSGRLLAIGRQALKQIALRIAGPRFSRPPDAERREIGRLMVDALQASEVYLWIGQVDFGALCLLWRMNLVEELDLDEQRFDILIGFLAVLSLSPLRALAAFHLQRIEKELPRFKGKPVEKVYLAGYAFASINRGEWRTFVRGQQAAVEAARREGDEFALQRYLGDLIWGYLYGVDVATVDAAVAEMSGRAEELPIRFYATVTKASRGRLLMLRGDLVQAAEVLADAYAQATQLKMPQVCGIAGGLLAECKLRLGDVQGAAAQAQWTLRGLQGIPLTIASLGFGLSAILEVYLSLRERRHGAAPPLRGALSSLRRLSWHCLVVQSTYEHYRARLAWSDGAKARALRYMARSLRTSEQMGLLRNQALAHYFLGRFAEDLDTADPDRARIRSHLESALRLFEHIGDAEYIARTRKALA